MLTPRLTRGGRSRPAVHAQSPAAEVVFIRARGVLLLLVSQFFPSIGLTAEALSLPVAAASLIICAGLAAAQPGRPSE
ncbi:MAG: hypothetical protein DMF99_32155 [Acidobacteria bacterium]|nr:MAG: hypothetical protein DMF99_32155 [Acidobacteriota bacterium]